jgi:hypothetical protein
MQNNSVNKFKTVGKLRTVKGSILFPHNAGLRLILSLSNTMGKPNCPLLPIFDEKWAQVRQENKLWFINKTGAYKLGAIKSTPVQSDTWVVHMLCQNELFKTDLKALDTCLKEITKLAIFEHASVHVSSILLSSIPELMDRLNELVIQQGVNVQIYE